jgi:hypothetical protein
VLVLALALSHAQAGRAHDGEDHRAPKPAPPAAAAEVPHRHADGTIVIPKPSQRLLGIRTVVAEPAFEQPALELTGRVVADPNARARVRAVREGVIEAAEGDLPHLGQRVERGRTLAVLVPVLPSAEEAQLRQKLIEIEREQALLLPRAEHAATVNPNMPMGDAAVALLNEIQIQAQALTRQAELIKATLAQKIEIKAPIAGTIAATHLRAGELFAARDVLVEIVETGKARVEAFAFGAAPAGVGAATAITDDGRALALSYLGAGPMLRGQATPLLFQVTAGAPVGFGAAVRVQVAHGPPRPGIKLPREAVQRAGETQVAFEHVSAEIFVARPVSVEPLDAGHVLVTRGIDAGARIVTAGAAFVGQVR